MYCKADIFLHIPWGAKHLLMLVENKYLTWFDNTDFLTLNNTFTTNPRYRKICLEYIFTRSASSLGRNEVKMDLILVIWRIIYFLWFLPLFFRKWVNHVLPGTPRDVVCDLLKFVCGTNMSNRKSIDVISAIQNDSCNVGQQAPTIFVFHS